MGPIPWAPLRKPISESTVALISTGGVHLRSDRPFNVNGDTTYRIIPKETAPSEDLRRKWQQLERSGCTYEQGSARLMAIDIPPKADIHEVYSILEEGEREGLWEFEEGHCGHPVTK